MRLLGGWEKSTMEFDAYGTLSGKFCIRKQQRRKDEGLIYNSYSRNAGEILLPPAVIGQFQLVSAFVDGEIWYTIATLVVSTNYLSGTEGECILRLSGLFFRRT